jgi:hypothetical protein
MKAMREGRLILQVITMGWQLAAVGCASPAPFTGGEKRVVIDKTEQILYAYEGEDEVFCTRVSTGKAGHGTPSGEFRAGVKHRMHYSSRYHNAPMPFSVQVNGHYFIHGYKEVPPYPASHGCVRVPLDGANPAQWFFHWVETGTRITIRGQWSGGKKPAVQRPKLAPQVRTRVVRQRSR